MIIDEAEAILGKRAQIELLADCVVDTIRIRNGPRWKLANWLIEAWREAPQEVITELERRGRPEL